jgi:hypothetical protein
MDEVSLLKVNYDKYLNEKALSQKAPVISNDNSSYKALLIKILSGETKYVGVDSSLQNVQDLINSTADMRAEITRLRNQLNAAEQGQQNLF